MSDTNANTKLSKKVANSITSVTVNAALQWAIPTDTIDAYHILSYVMDISLGSVMTDKDRTLTSAQFSEFKEKITLRQQGMPVDVILGTRGFWESDFIVTADVLSPRPDTETLIQAVLDILPDTTAPYTFLDLGCGSGCIITTLLLQYPKAHGVAADISPQALEITAKNVQKNAVMHRCTTSQTDWFNNIKGQYDVIISNPPYIPSADIEFLTTEVKMHDPILALDGGKDGLKPYRVLADNAHKYLTKNGIIVLEFGAGQHNDVYDIFSQKNYTCVAQYKDLSGHIRCQVYEFQQSAK